MTEKNDMDRPILCGRIIIKIYLEKFFCFKNISKIYIRNCIEHESKTCKKRTR